MIVTPVRTRKPREHDTGDVSKIVGYRITCECGERTASRSTVRLARADYRQHRRESCTAVTGEDVSPTVSAEG